VALAVGVVPPDREPPQVEAQPGDDGHDQTNGPTRAKKPTWQNTLLVFDHVGLLVNGAPGAAELPFV